MFPLDAENVRIDLPGNGTSTLLVIPSGRTYTVLYESYNTGDATVAANLKIACGPTLLLYVNNFNAVPALERFKMAKCQSDITVTILGMASPKPTTVSLIYTAYDTATAPAPALTFAGTVTVFLLSFIAFVLVWKR